MSLNQKETGTTRTTDGCNGPWCREGKNIRTSRLCSKYVDFPAGLQKSKLYWLFCGINFTFLQTIIISDDFSL